MEKKSQIKKPVIIAIVAVVCVAIVACAVFMVSKNSQKNLTGSTITQPVVKTTEVAGTDLNAGQALSLVLKATSEEASAAVATGEVASTSTDVALSSSDVALIREKLSSADFASTNADVAALAEQVASTSVSSITKGVVMNNPAGHGDVAVESQLGSYGSLIQGQIPTAIADGDTQAIDFSGIPSFLKSSVSVKAKATDDNKLVITITIFGDASTVTLSANDCSGWNLNGSKMSTTDAAIGLDDLYTVEPIY